MSSSRTNKENVLPTASNRRTPPGKRQAKNSTKPGRSSALKAGRRPVQSAATRHSNTSDTPPSRPAFRIIRDTDNYVRNAERGALVPSTSFEPSSVGRHNRHHEDEVSETDSPVERGRRRIFYDSDEPILRQRLVAKRSRSPESVFTREPRKQQKTDPLVHYGRHFGRTVRTFCRVQTILKNGVRRTMELELGRLEEEELTSADAAEQAIYEQLLALAPGLEERLNTGSDDNLIYLASLITKGAASARSDDTRSLKAAIVDWITPTNGVLIPPIQRNVKTDRGFYHPRTGELLCPCNLDWNDDEIRQELVSGVRVPSGDQWPRFLYRGFEYNPDDPWDGLLQSSLLVKAYKHVFTSPSSVNSGAVGKATRSSNARIHGMERVTIASIAYIATQVRFALSSTPTFCRTDTVTDSEYFYFIIIETLEDPKERVEVDGLLKWWNQQIFPKFLTPERPIHNDSVPAKIKERRRRLELAARIQRQLEEPQELESPGDEPSGDPQEAGGSDGAATSGPGTTSGSGSGTQAFTQ